MSNVVSSLSSYLRRIGGSLLGGEAQHRTRWTGQPVPPQWPGGVRPHNSTTLHPDSSEAAVAMGAIETSAEHDAGRIS